MLTEQMKKLLRSGTPIYLRDLTTELRQEYQDDPAVQEANGDDVVVGVYLDHAISADEYDRL